MTTDDGAERRDDAPLGETGPLAAPVGETGPLAAAAVERLAGLDGLPPEEHVRVYDDLHAHLQAALAATSGDSGSPGNGPRPAAAERSAAAAERRGGPVPRPPGRGA